MILISLTSLYTGIKEKEEEHATHALINDKLVQKWNNKRPLKPHQIKKDT